MNTIRQHLYLNGITVSHSVVTSSNNYQGFSMFFDLIHLSEMPTEEMRLFVCNTILNQLNCLNIKICDIHPKTSVNHEGKFTFQHNHEIESSKMSSRIIFDIYFN